MKMNINASCVTASNYKAVSTKTFNVLVGPLKFSLAHEITMHRKPCARLTTHPSFLASRAEGIILIN
jgi:hypothetical protein